MTREEITAAVQRMSRAALIEWLFDLGRQLTVCARADYVYEGNVGSIKRLMAFNEMQHQIYNYQLHPETRGNWPIEQLIETLFEQAAPQRIQDAVLWAMQTALSHRA